MASVTSWDETVPSGTSSIAQGDDDIRSLKSFMRSWISQEHYTTDGSSTSAGEHKLGSARAFQLPLSQISGVANRRGQLSHDTTNNYLWVGSGSSISQIAGAAVGSVNTWTAAQNFSGGAKIGAAGSAISSAVVYTEAVASVWTIAASGTSLLAIDNGLESNLTAGMYFVSLRAPSNALVQATAYYDTGAEALTIAVSNMSNAAVALPAQTIKVMAVGLI